MYNNKVKKTVFYLATTLLTLTLPCVHTQIALENAPALSSDVELSRLTPINYMRPVNNRFEQPPTTTGLRVGPETATQSLQPAQSLAEQKKNANDFRLLLEVNRGAQKFGLDLFSMIVYNTEKLKDVMISPFAIWSLLILLLEGASGNTYEQLHRTLNINVPADDLRMVFSKWQRILNVNTPTIEVASLQALFTSKKFPVSSAYEKIISDYGGTLRQVDFQHYYTYQEINRIVSNATRGLIHTTVLPQNLYNANMYILSSLYFKGQWKYPFNASLTRLEMFYDENYQPIGNVEMMVQENKFAFTSAVPDLNAYVLELPYGKEDRLSMLILLPKRNNTILDVVQNLQKIRLDPILKKLKTSANEDDVEVLMPKFTTATYIEMGQLLKDMGIEDAFDQTRADLSRIAPQLFVQNCAHSTKIIVDEEGTRAAGVASAILINKTSPPKFNLNKPFLYLIVEKTTQLLLFAGQVVNPSNSQ